MKKYVIKNKDGSKQAVMSAIYNTRREALLDYITDDSQIEDYIVEEVDMKDVNEVITDYESALKSMGPTGFYPVRTVEQNTNALIALNKLFTIAAAWNKLDGFVPDFSNWSQNKWTPLFAQTALTKRLELSTACMFSEVLVLDFALKHENVHGSLELSLSIYTIKCFCYEIQNNR